ncbi:1926_t:CDS:1, partial [Gigaspora margarita]
QSAVENYIIQNNIVIILEKQPEILTVVVTDKYLLFVRNKSNIIEKKYEYITKRTGCPFIMRVNYHKCTKEFTITRLYLEYNHILCPDAKKFSNVIHRLNQNNLGLIEKFHDDKLRTKDIFSIL